MGWKVYIKHKSIEHVWGTKENGDLGKKKKKALVQLFELQTKLATVFREHYFYENEQLANYSYSNLGVWPKDSWTWAKPACHFKKNNCDSVLWQSKRKPKLSNKNWEFGKTWTWRLPNKDVLVVRLINVIFFWCCLTRCVNIWKVCTLSELHFSNDRGWVKDPPKVQDTPIDFNVTE